MRDPDHDAAFAGYLDELERLCNAATPEPWSLDPSCTGLMGPHHAPIVEAHDAEFIVAARHALPKLIAKVRELQVKLDGSASVDAFNAIALTLGCPAWDYPGQLVRDVGALKVHAANADRAVQAADRLLGDALAASARAARAEIRLSNFVRRVKGWLEYIPDEVRDRPLYRDLQNLVDAFAQGASDVEVQR